MLVSAKNIVAASLAALTLGLALAGSTTPASADWHHSEDGPSYWHRWRHEHSRGYGRDWGYRHGWDYARGRDGCGYDWRCDGPDTSGDGYGPAPLHAPAHKVKAPAKAALPVAKTPASVNAPSADASTSDTAPAANDAAAATSGSTTAAPVATTATSGATTATSGAATATNGPAAATSESATAAVATAAPASTDAASNCIVIYKPVFDADGTNVGNRAVSSCK
jgi:hypothetical protein